MTRAAPTVDTISPVSRSASAPGVLLFAGAAVVLMGIITAEDLYPRDAHYNTRTSTVSDAQQ